MSRKRKANKKRQGGRVTPAKRTASRPSAGSGEGRSGLGFDGTDAGWLDLGGSPGHAPEPDPQPSVHSVFSAMAGEMESRRQGHPSAVEELASEFVSILAVAASEGDDEPSDGPPTAEDRDRAFEMLGIAATLLAQAERARPNPDYIDCLRALEPFVDAETGDEIRSVVDRADSRTSAPAWAGAIWRAAPVGAWRAGDLLGDALNLGIELAWPGDWEKRVLFGSLIVTEGPFVNDLVLATLDEFTEVYTPGTGHLVGPDDRPYLADVIRYLEPADVSETVRALRDGIAITDADGDAPVQPGFDALAAVARQVLDTMTPAPPADATPMTDAERAENISAFLDSPDAAELLGSHTVGGAEDTVGGAEVIELVGRIFDYAEQRSDGDAHRWSPLVAAAFLDWYHRTEIVSDEHDELLASVLDAWTRYCHRLKGWPASVTDETLARIAAPFQPSVDPTALWEQSLSEGLERIADELGGNLGEGLEIDLDGPEASEDGPPP